MTTPTEVAQSVFAFMSYVESLQMPDRDAELKFVADAYADNAASELKDNPGKLVTWLATYPDASAPTLSAADQADCVTGLRFIYGLVRSS